MSKRVPLTGVPDPITGCIPFSGHIVPSGYGQVKRSGKKLRAHRVAWEERYGPIPEGMIVCHTCDTPSCINVRHLFLGNNRLNAIDRNAKGRNARGERVAGSKLNALDVREIRVLYRHGVRQVVLAEEFGVTQANISEIVRRNTWTHVT